MSVGQANDPQGNIWPVLIVTTPVGQQIFWMSPDQAKDIGEGMVKAAQAISAGIILPSGPVTPPPSSFPRKIGNGG